MPRLIKNPRNLWGSTTELSRLEVQRTDLWTLDLERAIRGLSDAGAFSLGFPSYELQLVSVALPTLSVKADEFRRESRPIFMPSFDEAAGPVRVSFRVDSSGGGVEAASYSSNLIRFLFAWRSVVRSGRYPFTKDEEFDEDENFTDDSYKIPYRYPLRLKFGRGSSDGTQLDAAQQFELRGAWLSSIQLDEVSYTGIPQAVQAVCQFYVEDIVEHIATAP